jgi:hypothetical protein
MSTLTAGAGASEGPAADCAAAGAEEAAAVDCAVALEVAEALEAPDGRVVALDADGAALAGAFGCANASE